MIMLLARCYNNEDFETEVEVGQYVNVEKKTKLLYEVHKRSTGEYLFDVFVSDFEKYFEFINN